MQQEAGAGSQLGWHRAADDILAFFATRAATHQANARGAEGRVREVPSRLGRGKIAALSHQEPWPHAHQTQAPHLTVLGSVIAAVSAMQPQASVTPRQALLGDTAPDFEP